MTQQVLYNKVGGRVIQWQDTDQFGYPDLTADQDLLVVTPDEWNNQAGDWWVVSGALTQTDPNAPTQAQLLALAKLTQSSQVRMGCATALIGGFSSSALGVARNYPSQITDQLNLLNAAMASGGSTQGWAALLWCVDNGNEWTLQPHTAAQVQQVNADWFAFRQTTQQRCSNLTAQIEAATTVAAVQAINW